MEARLIRKNFFDFFKQKGHKIVDSAPIVVKNDPTLMFTNAGMNQFKDYFLGVKDAKVKRVANSQKCLRVSGKHNDLEEVGVDTYHHTMFEMLGNWSFGDYFKKEAIEWAWEMLVDVYQLPKDRIYVTIFGGDKEDGLEPDFEAYDYWKNIVDESRILHCEKKDNFWEMGEVGPCGPCSEVHIDLRSDEEREKSDGKLLVNKDHPLVIEIWNLVFIQYNRLKSGVLENLPEKHVDTGMGLERLAIAIQGKLSNYDSDIFTPLIHKIQELSGKKYGGDQKTDIAIRVIVDHIRAITFTIADGQLPSNNKAGYVIRRILRRAVRYGYTFLGFSEPFLYQLVEIVAKQFDGIFTEVKSQQALIEKVIKEEENSFLKTLENGLKRLDQIKKSLKANQIDGKTVFELYDTYGFPVDLTALIAQEQGLEIDLKGFQVEMEAQKSRSKNAVSQEKDDWTVIKDVEDIAFIGYDHTTSSESQIVRYRKIQENGKSVYHVVLDQTPFYAESGGQVGDTGFIISGDLKINVIDTKKENDLIIHITKELPKSLKDTFLTQVNENKRGLTENNHSATHLLHAALREVLGEHVQQRGSLVNEKVLRFDFSHFAKVPDEELRKIEHRVNEKVRENIALEERRSVPIAEAKEMGAMALFGEKYGDKVRVIIFDKDYSVELCGGTHVPATGKIGLFKIVSESAVAAGVRRIEAITATKAEEYVQSQFGLIDDIKNILKGPKDLKQAIQQLVDDKGKLTKEIEALYLEQLRHLKSDLKSNISQHQGIQMITEEVSVPQADLLKKLAFELKNEINDLFMVLAANVGGKPQIAVMISENIVKDKNLNAGSIVKELAKEIKGGGGGQPFFATAGGSELSGLSEVIKKSKTLIQ